MDELFYREKHESEVSRKDAGKKDIVKFSIPKRDLGNADIEFQARRSGKKFGTLKVAIK